MTTLGWNLIKEILLLKERNLMAYDFTRDFMKCCLSPLKLRITGAWLFPVGLDPAQNGEEVYSLDIVDKKVKVPFEAIPSSSRKDVLAPIIDMGPIAQEVSSMRLPLHKMFSPQDAAQALNSAVNLFLEIGRLNMAARYSKDIGEICQQEKDLENAAVHLNQAADLFDSEGQSSQANSMTQKISEIYAQLKKYHKATGLFEEIARKSISNNLIKYSVRGILLNAGICQLCRGDPVAINNSMEHYQDIDPTFSGTRECKLLKDLAASMDEGDVAMSTDAIKEFDSMTRLDPWKTTLLLKAKNELKKKEEKEDDLT
ncbi:alpha-soluble NSF attachment protein-like [Phragmites australis]|uniref:alpha-soluble NSF attachment protein-like n=1 Tax=Phragmites australis TaxID=29695 RepID=UPI002D78BF07|nr:alpha-soluble NSF attachment protein-like [Phragmites australis]